MKKIYIQPETEIVILSEEAICAVSDEFKQELGTQGVEGREALTKERGDWEIW